MSLFAVEPAGPRRVDPRTLAAKGEETSAIAAEKFVESGAHKTQCELVLEFLRAYGNPPPTSLELARKAGMDRYVVAKRLPDLEKQGLARKGIARGCRVSGEKSFTWEVV